MPTRRRVIVNTDAKNEADDQFAIVHALLTPMFDVRGLIAAHYGSLRSQRSMAESRDEIDLLLIVGGRMSAPAPASAGTIVTAVAPDPMTTTRRPATSRSAGQNCGWTIAPEKASCPGKSTT